MQFYWSESDLRDKNDSCESLAPFVMALFDGEATEAEAKRARAHLLVCQTCAQRWLDWNRSRDLLRTVSVPAPPPTLLWRVLMACRVTGYSDQNSKAKSSSSQKSAAKINAPAYSDGFGTPPAPDALRAQILAQTTRAAAYTDTVSSKVTKSRRTYPALVRPSFAVPALAMWLMSFQRDTLFVAQTPEPEFYENSPYAPYEQIETPRARTRNVSAHTTPVLKKLVATRAAVAHHDTHQASDENEPRVHETESRFERAPHEAEHEPRLVRAGLNRAAESHDEERDEEPEARPERSFVRLASVETAVEPRRTTFDTLEVPVNSPQILQAVSRPASLSGKKKTAPGMRTAHWELATPKLARLVETAADQSQAMRVSLPPSRSVSTTPRIATPLPTSRLADNFDGDDRSVDEVRSVVDDFRASLASDTGSESDSEDTFN
ncbi:hypothetical protein EON80_10360 [bacterium]|nr:MAG: hypothetical protein EON80_10360 [bacterium]